MKTAIALTASAMILAGATCTPQERETALLACSAANILAAAIVPDALPRHINGLNGLCALIPANAQPASSDSPRLACAATDEARTGPQTAEQKAARQAAGCEA